MSFVKVLNSPWNGCGYIKRKKADYYVAEGRAEWVGPNQLRLTSHPANLAAAARAAEGYDAALFADQQIFWTGLKRKKPEAGKQHGATGRACADRTIRLLR